MNEETNLNQATNESLNQSPVVPPLTVEPALEAANSVEPQVTSDVTPDAPVAQPVMQDTPVDTFTAVSQAPVEPVAPTPIDSVAPALSVDPMLGSGINPTPSAPEAAPKKKGNPKTIIIALVAVIALALGGFLAFKFLVVTPQKVYKTAIKEIFAAGKKTMGLDYSLKESIRQSGKITLDLDIEGFEKYSNYSINYALGLDVPNKKMEAQMGFSDKNKQIIDLFVYLLDTSAYAEAKDLYDKVIKLGDFGDYIDWDVIPVDIIEDINYVYDKTEDAMLNAIPDSEYKDSDATVKINGKDTKVTENYFEITEKNLPTILERIINTYKNDDKVLEIMADLTGMAKEDIKSAMDQAIEMMKTSYAPEAEEASSAAVRVSLYTKGKDLVGYALTLIDGDDKYEVVKAAFENGVGQVVIDIEGAVTITADLNKEVTNYKIEAMGETVATGKITKVSETQTDLSIEIQGIVVNISVDTKQESKKIATNKIVIEVKYEDYSGKVTIESKTEIGAKISDVNTNNAKDINSMTDADIEEITGNLEEKLEGTGLLELFEDLMDSGYGDNYYDDYYNDDYDYDYDYDDFDDDFGNLDVEYDDYF